jgi:transposase-like protein
MAERGVTVDRVSIYRWVQRFTPEFIEAARLGRHAPGDRWFADEALSVNTQLGGSAIDNLSVPSARC